MVTRVDKEFQEQTEFLEKMNVCGPTTPEKIWFAGLKYVLEKEGTFCLGDFSGGDPECKACPSNVASACKTSVERRYLISRRKGETS